MAAITLDPQTYVVSAGDSRTISVDYTCDLAKTAAGVLTEVLTGTPTITADSGDATLSSKQINTAAYIDKHGTEVAIGAAVRFLFTSSVAATYTISITVSSDAPQTWIRLIVITVQ